MGALSAQKLENMNLCEGRNGHGVKFLSSDAMEGQGRVYPVQ